ncbi:MAG: TIM barrel protein [Trueperaceae bacterium]|nr:TIM barrel protein [Trueperaceae bacterium]
MSAAAPRVGIGPIGWVNDDIRGWGPGYTAEQVMSDMAALGYAGSEMSYVYPQEPAALRAALAGHGLVLAGAYRWTNFAHAEYLEEELALARAHVDFCRAAGAGYANLAEGGGSLHWDRRGQSDAVEPLTGDQWARVCRAFDAVGAYARERGVTLCVHPHGGTAIERPADIERLFALTDPELVGYCLDTGHVAYGGGDPGDVTRLLAPRVRYVHLKDVRADVLERARAGGLSFVEAVKANVFCTPGAGALDFDPVMAALREAGYAGWYIVEAEQDPAVHDPYRVSGAAREFLRERYGL